jgi:hypothetical protein
MTRTAFAKAGLDKAGLGKAGLGKAGLKTRLYGRYAAGAAAPLSHAYLRSTIQMSASDRAAP